MTLFVTVILGLIFVILGLSADWPLWAWPTVAALLLVIAAVTHKILTPAREPLPREFLVDPDLPLPESERREQRVAYVALPSSVTDYDFCFSATVRWLVLDAPEDAPYINAAGLAVDAVLHRARAVTAQQPPQRSAFVQHQLDGALATMCADSTGRIMAMAQDVSLTLPEHDRERLAKLSDVRKDEDVWEHERNYERSKRAYLGDDVLKDTGSAVVWWLSRNEEEVEGAVDRIGLLAQLSAAANNDSVSPIFEHLTPSPSVLLDDGPTNGHVPPGDQQASAFTGQPSANGAGPDVPFDSLLTWFGFSAEDPDLDLFVQRLSDLAQAHGKTAVADEIKRRFHREEAERERGDESEAFGPPEQDEPPF
ncbi:phage holin family protein [Streptomyces sp. NPDC000877]|uniref:phage holin family protein n=1 Tax=unclassified Streptomyces TaxID=2593676 RepID=UPI00332A0AF7